MGLYTAYATMAFRKRGCRSIGRSLALHARGTGIETPHLQISFCHCAPGPQEALGAAVTTREDAGASDLPPQHAAWCMLPRVSNTACESAAAGAGVASGAHPRDTSTCDTRPLRGPITRRPPSAATSTVPKARPNFSTRNAQGQAGRHRHTSPSARSTNPWRTRRRASEQWSPST